MPNTHISYGFLMFFKWPVPRLWALPGCSWGAPGASRARPGAPKGTPGAPKGREASPGGREPSMDAPRAPRGAGIGISKTSLKNLRFL